MNGVDGSERRETRARVIHGQFNEKAIFFGKFSNLEFSNAFADS